MLFAPFGLRQFIAVYGLVELPTGYPKLGQLLRDLPQPIIAVMVRKVNRRCRRASCIQWDDVIVRQTGGSSKRVRASQMDKRRARVSAQALFPALGYGGTGL